MPVRRRPDERVYVAHATNTNNVERIKAAELNLQAKRGEVHLDKVLDEGRPRLWPGVESTPSLARGQKVGQVKTKQRTTDVNPRPLVPSRTGSRF